MPIRTTISLLLLSLLLALLYLHFTPQNPKPTSHHHHRRLLRGHHHRPSPPLTTNPNPTSIPPSLPPTQPPSPSLPKYPSSSFPTPTIPSTSTPFSSFPFFPSLPAPPPPPTPPNSVSSVQTFPANISSVLPTAPHSASSTSRLPTILISLLSVSLLGLLLSLLILHLRRRQRRSVSTKDARSDSVRLFPPPPPSTSNPSTEFLYLGTLVSPRGTSQPLDPTTSTDAGGGGAASGGAASPELRPLPPLPRQLGCSHGLVDHSDGSAPSFVSDPDPASTSVSSTLPTSSSPTRFSRSSKESESWSGVGRDAELRPPPIPPPPATMLRRPQLNQNSNLNMSMQRNDKPRLKPLFWDKVPSSSSRVMAWDHLKSGSFQLNEEMIQSLFGCKTAGTGPGKQFNVKNGVCSTGEDNVLIIDQKKSQNIAILLKALNMSKEQVCEALLQGNVTNIGCEMLEALMKMSPTKDEESKLKEYTDGSPFKLGCAEAFLKAVINVPFAFKRVDAMLFIANFDQELSYLKGSFRILEGACNELRNSRLFHKLLDAVLKTGNRINMGTHRGDARAFKLDTLLKLADLESNDGKTTLLHFIILEVVKSEKLAPQFFALLESELTNVKKASTIDPNELANTVSHLSNGIEKVRNVIQLNRPLLGNGSGLNFHETMTVFLQRAEEEILKIQDQENLALSSVRDMAEYFHGDSAKEENEPFRIFGVVRDFLALLDGKICKEAGKVNDCEAKDYAFQTLVNADRIPSLI
ncbi:Formin-like protein [Rhynchospora pubera]|uniref:Formin-like protein n=1 Tax=Rhynchospora pubera TaxID=906938 RepID=A0AAV8C953_9POAL|nr:Formin-like protein [Rhynchospora pubera]